MNSRRLNICFELATNRNQSLSKLANKFNVTERTIRIDIDKINDFLKKNNLKLISLKTNGNIIFNEDKKRLFNVLDNLDYYEYRLSAEERVEVMILCLFVKRDYVTISELADFMCVSRATVVKDLELLRVEAQRYNLGLESQPSRGLKITDSDVNSILTILINNLNGVIRFFNQKENLSLNFDKYQNIYELKNIIEKIIKDSEYKSGFYLTKHSFLVLQHYLLLFILSLKDDEIEEAKSNNRNNNEFTDLLITKLNSEMKIKINEERQNKIYYVIKKLNFIKKKYSNPNILKIQIVTRKFIENLSKDLSIDLNRDYMFFESLSNHLSTIIDIPIAKIEEYNEVVDYVKKHDSILKKVQNNLEIIEKIAKRKLNQMEIYFIVIYVITAIEKKKNGVKNINILVICSGGVGTSHLVKEKLNNILKDYTLYIANIHNYKEYIENKNIDLILSMVKIDNENLNYIRISPFLSDEDIQNIFNKIDEIKLNKIMNCNKEILLKKPSEKKLSKPEDDTGPRLVDFIPKNCIKLDVEASCWRDAIRKAALPLLENNYIEKRYISAMIKNIEDNGPYIVVSKGFAIPHASSEEGVLRPAMSLIKLKESVKFQAGNLDPIKYVACLSPVGNTHLKAFFTLVNGLQNAKLKSMLFEANNLNAIIETLELMNGEEL